MGTRLGESFSCFFGTDEAVPYRKALFSEPLGSCPSNDFAGGGTRATLARSKAADRSVRATLLRDNPNSRQDKRLG